MSNQPQAHVADERAAHYYDPLHLVKQLLANIGWSGAVGAFIKVDDDLRDRLLACIKRTDAARAAIPAGADVRTLAEFGALRQLKHNDGSEGFVTAYDYEATNRYVAMLHARIAAGAPAETPKPARTCAAARNAQERVDAMHSGVVGVFAAIKAEHAAQPAPTPATDARDGERLDLIETLVKENGYCYIHQNRSRYDLIGLGLLGETLRESLDALALRRAAMLSANSPREAG